eukprot:7618098-Alexandrium_andersonii.AAC.1
MAHVGVDEPPHKQTTGTSPRGTACGHNFRTHLDRRGYTDPFYQHGHVISVNKAVSSRRWWGAKHNDNRTQ